MVKERRGTALPSGVCIGILLLLSNTVLADTVKDPAASLDKSFTVSGPKSSTFEGGNETRTNKIPSEEEAKATLPERGDGRAVDFRDRKNGYAADREIEEVENVAMPIGESSNLEEGIGAGEKNDDWLSTTAGSDVSSKLVSRIPNTGVTGTATAKAFAEEAKLVERKNKTSEGVPLNETASSKEQESAAIGSDNGVVVKLEEDREKNDSSPRQLHFLQEPRERKKAESRNAVKNLEILDLEKKSASEKKADDDGSTSLINDTYVNYSHLYRVSTVGSADTKRENESKALETSTSTEKSTVTSPESASTDPKNEVEVVGNVTHATILERQSENFSAKDSSPINEVIERPKTEGKKAEEIEKATSSPIPRGRTMAFAEVANEFSDLYVKPTIASNPRFSTFAKKNSTDKSYLHVKSAGKGQPDNASNEVLVTSEGGDASALENTIGRGRSEEKLIVTEASDVLENSIQQLIRPGYSEEASNESSSSPLTTISLSKLGEIASTHRTPIDRLPDSRERVAEPKEKSTIAGNNVSEWIEGQESTITGNDVTGNGITEASPKPRTDQLLQEIANKSSIPSVHATTTESMKLQTDVQINAEGSLLLRSTLNATETSTEYSLTKGNNSDVTLPPTVTSTAVERSSTENVTESGMEAGTEAESTSVTLRPEENFTATTTVTTTGIEFEFVGLTESVASSPRSGNESSTEAVSSGIDDSTISNEVVGPNLSTTLPTEETTVAATTLSVDDQTTARSSVIEEETDRTTPTGATDGEVDSTVAIGVDLPRITTVEGDLATTSFVVTEQTLSSDPKDFPSTIATTDLPAIATTVDSYIPFDFEPTVPPPSPSVPADLPSTKSSDGKVVPQDHGEITSLVRIDVRGSWYDVCPHMDKLKVALASVLSNGTNRSVSDEQIILHQDPCQEPPGESSGTTTATSTPTDVPITSILLYVVDKTGKFDATMTESLPGWYEEFRERVSFPLQIHRFRLVQETIPDSGNAIAAIVVSSIAFVCLVLLAGLLFVMRKRQTRFNYGERCRPVSLDAYSLDSVSAYNSVRRKGVARSSKRSYGNPTFEDSSAIPSHPLNFAGLSSFCNDVHAIDAEFASIPQISPKIDELPAGAEVKNRFANVIPLPETRVPLQKINDDPLSEYINASYVRGPKNATRYYIACQAPMDSTVTDFWRMIWEQQCKVIVMLTDLAENGVEKCTEYIPPSEVMDCHRLYGDYQVTLKKRETKEKYAISMVQLKNLENNTFRDVYHIWYLWPVNGTQSDGAGLIAVLLEARALQRGGPGPIVVHCSPGTGRTGTLIALDLGIRQYEITRTVDVPRVVYTIRRDRAGAVQTKEQYAFIYKALNLYATKLAGGVLEST